MEPPKEFMDVARAKASALLDQLWSTMEAHKQDIQRIAEAGPAAPLSEGDANLIQALAALMNSELNWRIAERARLEMQGPDTNSA
jgi:alanine-alpha-ketoisovalerate/valine-pyruvate aminotransferase